MPWDCCAACARCVSAAGLGLGRGTYHRVVWWWRRNGIRAPLGPWEIGSALRSGSISATAASHPFNCFARVQPRVLAAPGSHRSFFAVLGYVGPQDDDLSGPQYTQYYSLYAGHAGCAFS